MRIYFLLEAENRQQILRSNSDDVSRTLTFASLAVQRGRSWFFHKKRNLALLTGRAFFYNRYVLRGVEEIHFLGVPSWEYKEVCEKFGKGGGEVRTYFTRWDDLTIRGVVGGEEGKRIKKSDSEVFSFS